MDTCASMKLIFTTLHFHKVNIFKESSYKLYRVFGSQDNCPPLSVKAL